MAVSELRAMLRSGVDQVWRTVTDVSRYGEWRSDLERTEVCGDGVFAEYTKDGYTTIFTVTAAEPCRRWEFDLENSNIQGHWAGLFVPCDQGTEIVFTETVTAKKFLLRPFVGAYLKKQQVRFLADLKRALGESAAT